MYITKRCFVRIISYLVAVIAVVGIMAAQGAGNVNSLKQRIKTDMSRSVEDLSAGLESIKNTLDKGIYAGTPPMMSHLSQKLLSDASAAKISLSQLPVSELHLENTYKFLSQVGNYASGMAKRCSAGETLSNEDKENLKKLAGYAKTLSDNMWSVEQRINSGELSYEKTSGELNGTENERQPRYITEGFTEFEEGFDSYPTLIYDGPFSDHILEKEPLMLKNAEEVSLSDAQAMAEKASGKTGLYHSELADEQGKMPSYVFSEDSVTVSVTKNGGYLSYMTNYRKVENRSLSAENAVKKAEIFLSTIGINDVTDTYYEINENICTINFAATKGDITFYTDLIKVSVAMDNGEILGADCRGYLVNHTDRALEAPKLSKVKASESVSDLLSINKVKLCVIPSEGLNEHYCYEFSCTAENGGQVLTYINADNGYEEQILLLKISENGTLTV